MFGPVVVILRDDILCSLDPRFGADGDEILVGEGRGRRAAQDACDAIGRADVIDSDGRVAIGGHADIAEIDEELRPFAHTNCGLLIHGRHALAARDSDGAACVKLHTLVQVHIIVGADVGAVEPAARRKQMDLGAHANGCVRIQRHSRLGAGGGGVRKAARCGCDIPIIVPDRPFRHIACVDDQIPGVDAGVHGDARSDLAARHMGQPRATGARQRGLHGVHMAAEIADMGGGDARRPLALGEINKRRRGRAQQGACRAVFRGGGGRRRTRHNAAAAGDGVGALVFL